MVELNYYDLKASVCRESYLEFVKTFWHTVIPDPMVMNWHIPYLCGVLQEHMTRVFNGEPKKADLVVNISPGTSKSTLFTTMLVPWAWTIMPGLRYIGTSFAEDLAFDLSVKSRSVIQSPLYKKLFPYVEIRQDVNNKGWWANTSGGDRYAVGMNGNITGRHAHVIGIDDPLNPRGGRSLADLTAASQYCCETLPSRKTNKEVSWTYLVMQRISVSDPTALFLKRPDVEHICLPGELTDDVYPKDLRDYYVDGLFDPTRLSRRSLDQMKVEYGTYGYAGQVLQNPIPPGGGMFKTDRIQQRAATPPYDRFTRIVRYWDNAATQDGGDWTVGVKMGVTDTGEYWLLDVTRGQWSSERREMIKRQVAESDGINVRIGIEEEHGASGKDSALQATRNLSGFIVTMMKPTGDKVLRADTYSVQVNTGNVYTALSGQVLEDYITELQYFPDGRFDDQVDASSGAFSMLINKRIRLGVL